jgi:Tol biopolymer transport system component
MHIRSLAILVLALAITVVACGRAGSESATTTGAPTDAPGLLVVSQADASIFTIKPDGSSRTDLVEGPTGLVAIQPAWSPDGTRLVWTEVDHMSEVPEAFIVTAGPGGEEVERVSAPVAPFYYYWSPDGNQIAFLAGGPGGRVDLGILDGAVRFIGGAQPYYFAWAPDGQTLLTHTDLETVALLTTDGTATTLEKTEARFQAPQWAADGTRLVFATGTPPATGGVRTGAFQSNGQEIVVADTAGAIQHGVKTFAGVATFELSPDGRQIAYSITLDRNTFNFGPLMVTDLDSGDETTVSQKPVLAYQWSPAGDALLYLAAEGGIDHPAFRWVVWDGESSTQHATVTPTPSFSTAYLPFWDQYSRSHSVWAPDGSAFAYTGLTEAGDSAVWVQTVDGDAEPSQVALGDVVFWSPRPG